MVAAIQWASMWHRIRRSLALALLVAAPLAAEIRQLTILHTNDLHARLMPLSDGRGGFAYLAATIRRERSNCDHCILLNAGDLVQGTPVSTLFHGLPVYEIANMLGYDAGTLGNHEFDYGWLQARKFVQTAKYPIVSAQPGEQLRRTLHAQTLRNPRREGIARRRNRRNHGRFADAHQSEGDGGLASAPGARDGAKVRRGTPRQGRSDRPAGTHQRCRRAGCTQFGTGDRRERYRPHPRRTYRGQVSRRTGAGAHEVLRRGSRATRLTSGHVDRKIGGLEMEASSGRPDRHCTRGGTLRPSSRSGKPA